MSPTVVPVMKPPEWSPAQMIWPNARRRGRPTVAERDFRRRLETQNRERIARGLVNVLVWEGMTFCSSKCIVDFTGLFDKDTLEDVYFLSLFPEHERHLPPAALYFMPPFIAPKGRLLPPVRDRSVIGTWLGILRDRVSKGQWPLPRYEVRHHYAADVDALKCRGCRGAFRKTRPDTEWTRRLRREHKKRREQARLKGQRERRLRFEASIGRVRS
jgi:hypothetical protein